MLRNRATVETGLISDQARFLRCLSAIALLGALFLFAAPPASAGPRQHLTGLSMSANGTAVPITHTSTSADGQIWFYTATVSPDTTSVSVTPTWTATVVDAQISSATPDHDNVITNAITVSTSGTSASVNLASSGDTWVSVALFYERNAATDYRIIVSKPPAAPTGLTVTAGNGELRLAWTRPVDAIAGYDVAYTSASSSAVADTAAASGSDPSVAWVLTRYNPSSSATSWTISGLTNNTDYRVRVRAIARNFLESPWVFATGKPKVPPRQHLTGLSLSVDGIAVPITETFTSADGQTRSYTASVPHDTTSVSITPTWTATGVVVQVGSIIPYQYDVITDTIIVSASGTSNSVNLASSGNTLVWIALFYADGTASTYYDIIVSRLQPPAAQIAVPAQTRPTIRMSVSPNPVDEGSSVTVTLTLSETAASQVVIPVTLTAIWAESGDYGPLSSITIPAGETIGTGTITTAQDADAEHETFRLVLGAPPAGYAMPLSQMQIMIRDDEAAGAAPIARAIHDNQTPGLSVFGSIVDEGAGVAKEGFRVKVKNLTTKASVSEISSVETADGYSVTLVDLANARATRVGDVLEISAESLDPRIGVEPVRHLVTVDDVKRGTIQLEDLIAYEIPAGTELLRNYPNPFNPETWIPYRLSEDADVSLTIYDANGGLVRSIDVGHQSAAVYESRAKAIYWDGRNQFGEQVASGVYFYSLSAGDFSATRKMVILK